LGSRLLFIRQKKTGSLSVVIELEPRKVVESFQDDCSECSISRKTNRLLARIGCTGLSNAKEVYTPHEDLIGNPIQFMVMGFTGLLLVFPGCFLVFIKNYRRYLLLTLAPVLSWILFGLTVKYQPGYQGCNFLFVFIYRFLSR